MSLTLSPDDLRRLQATLAVLVSPLDFMAREEWGHAIGVTASAAARRRPVHRRRAASRNPPLGGHPGRERRRGGAGLPRVLRQPGYTRPASAARAWLEVYSRDMLYRSGERDRDELYQDWCVPYLLHDQLGMGVAVPDDPEFPALAHFYHQDDHGPQFGERGEALIHLLLPAFKAGVRAWERLTEHQALLERVLNDRGGVSCDLSGRLVHQNASFTRMLEREPDRERLLHEALRVARGVGHLMAGPSAGDGSLRQPSPDPAFGCSAR